MIYLKWSALFCLLLTLALPASVRSHGNAVRGIRVDPAYLYEDYPGLKAKAAAAALVRDVAAAHVNTIFLYTYSPVYGAYYPTRYKHTAVESGHGTDDIVGAIIAAAKVAHVEVIATFPVNTFKHAWDGEPHWRSKHQDGSDYRPAGEIYPLSAWHPEFQSWYGGLLKDFLASHPFVSGLEAHEGGVDFHWNGAADYNPVASRRFAGRFPASSLGDEDWKRFRAEGFTSLVGILSETAHGAKKIAYFVQTITAKAGGGLMAFDELAQRTGFDFKGIMALPARQRPDAVVGELNWQQWRAEHGNTDFDPAWTERAGRQFLERVPRGMRVVLHMEATKFTGAAESIEPTLEEFRDSIESAARAGTGATGLDVYDFHQLKSRGGLAALTEAYRGR